MGRTDVVIDRTADATGTKVDGSVVDDTVFVTIDFAVVYREVRPALNRNDPVELPTPEPPVRFRERQIVEQSWLRHGVSRCSRPDRSQDGGEFVGRKSVCGAFTIEGVTQIIHRLCIRVIGVELKTVGKPLAQCRLESVVIRIATVRTEVDIAVIAVEQGRSPARRPSKVFRFRMPINLWPNVPT